VTGYPAGFYDGDFGATHNSTSLSPVVSGGKNGWK
jgi:hypothetical protein